MHKLSLFIFLFSLLLTACRHDYIIQQKSVSNISLDEQSEDEKINQMISPFRDSLSLKMKKVIGKSELMMNTQQPQGLLGNFICDMLLSDLERQLNIKPGENYFALMNTRGLRAPLPEGEIHVENIFEIMPFENAIVIVEVNGETILEMGDFLKKVGGHPISYNMAIDASTDSVQIKINQNAVVPEQRYFIITSDYLAAGGDKMDFLTKGKITETNVKLRDFILDYIEYLQSQGKTCTSKLDNRFVYE